MRGDVISGSSALTGFYELELTRRVVNAAKYGGRMIDVGANLGYFTLLWLASNPKNTCVSIEASPRNLPLLAKNVADNGFEKRCQIEGVAASFQPGLLHFDLGPADQSGWGGLVTERRPEGVDVTVRRIDEIITDCDPVSLLKIDVEGADTWALLGCERLLARKQVKLIYYEQNKDRLAALGIGADEAQDFLRKHNYVVKALNDPADRIVEYAAAAE